MNRIATTLRLSVAALALTALAGTAFAQVTPEPLGQYSGHAIFNHITGTTQLVPSLPSALPAVVYDNLGSTANFAFSSTDLAAAFGDELFLTGLGTLSEMGLTIYNSSSSVGPLLTAVVGVTLYDGGTLSPLGSYSANFNFGAGLPIGYYSTLTVTGLDALNIDVNTTDVIVVQTVLSKTGTANRLGIVSFDPPTVGSSGPDMYISATTVGAPGWYTITGSNANPGYTISADANPVPASKSTWGRVKSLYR